MSKQLARLGKSFAYAAQGFWHCVRYERNFRIHLIAAAWMTGLAYALDVGGLRLAVLVLTVAAVIVMEMLNTAIEAVTDLVTKEYRPLAKIAKDVSAGAVLVCAAASVAVGVLLLWQPRELQALLQAALAAPPALAALLCCAGISVWFALCGGAEKGKETL